MRKKRVENKRECSKCRKLIVLCAVNKHESACDGSGPRKNSQEKYLSDGSGKRQCPYCQMWFVRVETHIRSHLGKSPMQGKESWNRGLSKDTDARIAETGKKVSKIARLKRKKINLEHVRSWRKYKGLSRFEFDIMLYPDEFDLVKLQKHGRYSPINGRNNLNGISFDHRYSVHDGFVNGVDPNILKHPANCELMFLSENLRKSKSSSITLQDLMKRIFEWNQKYPE